MNLDYFIINAFLLFVYINVIFPCLCIFCFSSGNHIPGILFFTSNSCFGDEHYENFRFFFFFSEKK